MKISSSAFPILIFAATISIFTQLRFSFFGVGEILILGVFLATLTRPIKRDHLHKFTFSKFWLAYICLSVLGAEVNYFLLNVPTGTPEQMMFDLAAYVFVLIACFTFERMYFENLLDVRKFLTGLFFFSGGMLASLYLVSFYTSSLFGFALYDYDHFAPLVVNVHQASMYMVVLPFVGILLVFSSSGFWLRIVTIALVVATIAMSFAAATTKADMAIVVGFVVLSYSYTLTVVGKRYRVLMNLIYIVAIIGFLFWIDSASLIREFFTEADPHGARKHLYSSSVDVIAGSPIFGHGPGPHVLHWGTFWDVHQTHLAILLQTGVLGLIVYLIFSVKILARIRTEPALLAAFAAIFTYSAGGDILRRLPIWILLLLIYYWQDPGSRRMRSSSAIDALSRTPRASA